MVAALLARDYKKCTARFIQKRMTCFFWSNSCCQQGQKESCCFIKLRPGIHPMKFTILSCVKKNTELHEHYINMHKL
jgi:hypothetical protein